MPIKKTHEQFLKDLKNSLSDLFYFSLGQGTEPFAGAADLLKEVSAGFVARLTRQLGKLIDEIKFSDNALVSAEVGLFTIMDNVLDVDGFIRRLEALERGEALPPSTPSVPPARKTSTPRSTPAAKKPEITNIVTTETVSKTKATKIITSEIPVVKTNLETLVQPVPASTPTTEPLPALDKTISDRQIWDKMLEKFATSPFVHDVMINSSVQFTSESEWTLMFAPGKEFYQLPAQHKLPELSATATELVGRKITLKLADDPALRPAATPKAAEVQTKQIASQKTVEMTISDEEPFVAGNFEADITNASVPDNTPEEVKEILEMFPGELLA